MNNQLTIASLFFVLAILSTPTFGKEAREYFPLPATSLGPNIDPEKGYTTERLTKDVYMVTDGLYQAIFAVTTEGVVVVDAPPTIGANLPKAIAEKTERPVTHLIYSHSHIDHIGSAHLFGSDVVRIASQATSEKLARFNDSNRPPPTKIFETTQSLTVGTTQFELKAGGGGHEPGNLFIHLPVHKVLMAVDLVFPGWVPFTNLGMAEDIGEYIENHHALLEYEFDIFVGGHVGRAGTRADVITAQNYLKDLVAFADEGRGTVNFYEIAKSTGYENKWLLVKTYMDAIADHCARKMLDKWGTKLGGADVSTPGHCWVTQEFLNINGTPSFK
jgi:glyoxylase-like metal-dependent hydrolase (beta-lactamase superfamily II)